ncbi:hypothetical protein CC1G_04681 [Coprinopsis cinerea okayama7|uniref:Uncharacterized protein n=1 Tax=Coprinopsis cinerea (strain Okayama-7 / 130 / ATCC MYA-4618 / FGSC 9003) TaxID=240176 RepID=A8N4Y1_COPC7|nr:hypothetical protein CC1G_04681 [Coprinopsis cinerea okayama7\|eukprot:XP_001829992.1 hypothetical protein CC1G_04681 [Coprinopsis cinerea okayama7\
MATNFECPNIDVKTAINLIDAEIAKLEVEIPLRDEHIRQLKSNRNDLIHASSLLIEILREILWLCVATTPVHKPLEWIPLTHVCSRWRKIALDYPQLWSRIYDPETYMGPSWLTAFIERSKNAPTLDISNNTGFRSRDPATHSAIRPMLSQILSQTARLREVNLNGSPSMKALLAPMTSSAPQLQSLTIENWSLKEGNVFPDHFLNGHAPRLRRLVLDNCYFPPNPSVFANITTLQLTFDARLTSHPPARGMIADLDKIPALTKLTLDLRGYVFPKILSLPERLVLRRLSELTVVGEFWQACSPFLNAVKIPPGPIALSIIIRDHIIRSDDLDDIRSKVSSIWLSPSASSTTPLPLESPTSLTFRIQPVYPHANHFSKDVLACASGGDSSFSLWLRGGFNQVVAEIDTPFSLHNVEHLELALDDWTSRSRDIQRFLDFFPSLRTIALCKNEASSALVKCLKEKPTQPPFLTRIQLRDVDFACTYDPRVLGDPPRTDEVEFLEAFIQMLHARKAAGKMIGNIEIVQCKNLSLDGVQRMKDEVMGDVAIAA